MIAKEAARIIVRKLREEGHQAYFVGGCVRDLLLEREPADFDIATSATPGQVMEIFPRTYAVGTQFGVVLVPASDLAPAESATDEASSQPSSSHFREEIIEVATFRSDGAYFDGRRPQQVSFTASAEEDVRRRDFTINGLLFDPEKDEVLDFVGGRFDLNAGILRTIGDPRSRFTEDRLRMLRAIRFAARLGYQVELETMLAIREFAAGISEVSKERVREELLKMLTEGKAGVAFAMLNTSGLLQQVLPEVAAMKGVQQPPQYHPEGDVWVHTLMMLGMLPAGVSPTLAMGVLLHDAGKPPTFRVAPDRIRFDGHVTVGVKMAEAICKRLRFSNEDTAQILSLVANHMRFADVKKMKDSTFKRFLRLPRFEEHLELHRIDCLASHAKLEFYDFISERRASMPPEAIHPRPLLSGTDLMAAGYPAGPRFKEILAALEDAQLEGRINSRSDALEYLAREFPKL